MVHRVGGCKHAIARWIECGAIINAKVEVDVVVLRAHVSDCLDKGVIRVHSLDEDLTDTKVDDLNLMGKVDKEVEGLDVIVDDVLMVEVGQLDV